MNEEEYFGIINDSSVNNQSESDTSTESNIDEPEEHWDINSEDIIDFDQEASSDSEENSPQCSSAILSLFSTFLLLWGTFYGISAAALNHLIQFLHYMFSLLSSTSTDIAALETVFPTSLYMIKKKFNLLKDPFEKYVICPKCVSLYKYEECFQTNIRGQKTPKKCNHIAFRHHPIVSFRKPCGSNLLKEVITKTDKKYYPCKTYCYYPLSKSITNVLCQQSIMDQCEHWRNRVISENVLADVYDGRVWKKFMKFKDKPFLSEPYNLGLMLNCDWFQPFDHSTYSVGVLYLVILNLPRTIRFKPENVLIAGVIPGPKEPSLGEMNSYLRPLVKELNWLWSDGFKMQHKGKTVSVHAALLATVCDIPATAKLGGFLGHSSKHACWKCSKEFPHNESLKRVDFSGVEVGTL